MTREQKLTVAAMLIQQAGNLIETWDERIKNSSSHDILSDADPREAAQLIANWLGKLPGEGWDVRLPQPTVWR